MVYSPQATPLPAINNKGLFASKRPGSLYNDKHLSGVARRSCIGQEPRDCLVGEFGSDRDNGCGMDPVN